MENEQIFSGDENGDPIKPKPYASKIDEKYGVGNKTWEKKGGRWTITTKKEILQWDSKKGEIEVYSRGQKKHLGGFDPYNRGKQISPSANKRTPNGGWKVTTSKTSFSVEKIIKPIGKIFRVFDLMAIPALTMEQLQWGDPTNYQQQL